jgi:hypothetical protein
MTKWEMFKWTVEQLKEMKKKSAPFATLGVKLILGSLALFSLGSFVLYIVLPPEFIINEIKYTNKEISTYSLNIGVYIIFIGTFMILFEMYNYKKARKTGKLIIQGMRDSFKKFPTDILSYEEKNNSRDTIYIGMIEDENSLDKQIRYYNSEKQIDLYNRFIFNDEIEKLYVCGISRIPFLVGYGYCLKGSVSLKYVEREHCSNKSFSLDCINEKIELKKLNDDIKPSSKGNIGIAIGFTSEIKENQLPDELKTHTLFISSSIGTNRLLFKNQSNLQEVIKEVLKQIDIYSSIEYCKRIHLFLSVQASFAIELGRHFQEGVHKNWVIHNYNGKEGKYSWAIELSKENIKKYN